MKGYTQHPLSVAFPALSAGELTALTGDIRAHGLREPITLYDGQVLDGWHRYRACIAAHVEPSYVEFDGDDPVAFVWSKNGHRRHLTGQQRAQAAVKCAAWKPLGANQHDRGSAVTADPPSAGDLAKAAKVPVRSITRAKTIERAGLGDPVRDGDVSAMDAEAIALGKPAPVKKNGKSNGHAQPDPKIEKLEARIEALTDAAESAGELHREVEKLRAVAAGESHAAKMIADLQKQIVKLEGECKRLTVLRDATLNENAQLKREVKMLRKQLGQEARV